LETLITMDTGLATSVLRTANSAYFGNASRCDNIADAVLRLGSKTLYRIAANTLTGRWLVHPLRGYGWEPGDLCRHSLCVAICAEVFAGMTNLADTSTAYTAGLIHDLGKFALAYANLSALDEVASRVPNEYATWREAETAILGYDSSQVTKALLENWGFPSTFVSVGQFYQTPSECPDSERKIATLIHAAKHVATQIGYGVGVDGFYYEPDEDALKEVGFKDDEMDAAIPEILATIQRFISPSGEIRFT
ncbi:MAG: HDOD domain-containing protein, partial [Verrucomicrobia bacterium]|nr:HDOD domain-containing protein [Verrucomicrobiota bacterium]